MKSKTNWKRVDRLTSRAITRAAAADPDSGLPDRVFWKKAKVVPPAGKSLVSLRLDNDVLEWFRKHGKGYQSHMNSVLRSYAHFQKQEG